MATNKYVAYIRVSTARQGRSGLGLDAQRQTIKANVGQVAREFVEVESGKHHDRPVLKTALAYCQEIGGTLVIAKLDRLSREVAFIFALRDAGVSFLCCDIPDCNTATLGIYASLAQHEREIISERTKAALAAKKRQGYKLGKPENLTPAARIKGYAMRHSDAQSRDANVKAYKVASSLRRDGLSLRQIVAKFDEYGLQTVNGNNFTACSVQKLLRLFEGNGNGTKEAI